jgi:Protein of unknown function (DUF2637)
MSNHSSHPASSAYGPAPADPAPARPARPAEAHRVLRLLALTAVSLGVLVLAAAAFLLSYPGIHAIALQAGVSPPLARVYPVILDAMLVIACAAVLSLRGAGAISRSYAWLALLVLLAAAAGADALHSAGIRLPHRPAAAAAAIIPWALVLIGFGLLLAMLRHARLHRAAVAARDTFASGPGTDVALPGHQQRAAPPIAALPSGTGQQGPPPWAAQQGPLPPFGPGQPGDASQPHAAPGAYGASAPYGGPAQLGAPPQHTGPAALSAPAHPPAPAPALPAPSAQAGSAVQAAPSPVQPARPTGSGLTEARAASGPGPALAGGAAEPAVTRPRDQADGVGDGTGPTVDRTGPTVDETRPTVDETRPTVDETRPTVDETGLGADGVEPAGASAEPATTEPATTEPAASGPGTGWLDGVDATAGQPDREHELGAPFSAEQVTGAHAGEQDAGEQPDAEPVYMGAPPAEYAPQASNGGQAHPYGEDDSDYEADAQTGAEEGQAAPPPAFHRMWSSPTPPGEEYEG